jgi:16S rRNA (cytosine967-C5)-methyltransferase
MERMPHTTPHQHHAGETVATKTSRDPRDLVITRIARELNRRPDFSLSALNIDHLDERDLRLAQALYIECLRHLITLEFLVDSRLDRNLADLQVELQAALIVGACQIFFFDALPDHAVVNETVNWARTNVRDKAGGLVNAVLHRLIDQRGELIEHTPASLDDAKIAHAIPRADGRFVELKSSEFPDAPFARRSVQTSHPVDLISRWSKRVGSREALDRLLLHNLAHPPTVIAGLTEAPTAYESSLRAVHDESGLFVWTGTHDTLAGFLAQHPSARVQDAASYAIVHSTADFDLSGANILDLCAGSGTKTMHLRQLHPSAAIVASDPDARRFAMLQARFDGDAGVEIVEASSLVMCSERFDLILVDVPCSNTGVLARRIEAKYRCDREHLNSLTELQRQILIDAVRMRAPGGAILYATCSLEPQENQEQMAWLRKWHSLHVTFERMILPAGLPGGDPAHYRDGSYHAMVDGATITRRHSSSAARSARRTDSQSP